MTLYSLIFAVFFIQPSIQNYNELYELHNKRILDDDIVNANFYALGLTGITYLLFAFYVTYNRFFKIKSKRKIKNEWKLIWKIFILSIKQKLLLISKAIDKISSILYGFSSFTLSFIAIKTALLFIGLFCNNEIDWVNWLQELKDLFFYGVLLTFILLMWGITFKIISIILSDQDDSLLKLFKDIKDKDFFPVICSKIITAGGVFFISFIITLLLP